MRCQNPSCDGLYQILRRWYCLSVSSVRSFTEHLWKHAQVHFCGWLIGTWTRSILMLAPSGAYSVPAPGQAWVAAFAIQLAFVRMFINVAVRWCHALNTRQRYVLMRSRISAPFWMLTSSCIFYGFTSRLAHTLCLYSNYTRVKSDQFKVYAPVSFACLVVSGC